jgi:hypothetical protein
MADKIVHDVRGWGGRFLIFHVGEGVWKDAEDKVPRLKVLQVWRNLASYGTADASPSASPPEQEVRRRSQCGSSGHLSSYLTERDFPIDLKPCPSSPLIKTLRKSLIRAALHRL